MSGPYMDEDATMPETEPTAAAVVSDRRGIRVVFLGHATDRTGPPIVLLHLLRWLHEHTDWQLATVALRGGDLEPDFAAVSDTYVLNEGVDRAGDDGHGDDQGGRDRSGPTTDDERRALLAPLAHPDLVFVNTAWSIHALRYLTIGDRTPILGSIHELDTDLRDGMPPASLADLIGRPDHFLAGAQVMADNLVAGYGVPRDRITVVPESIALPDLDAPPALRRLDLGLADEDFVIVAAGTPVWRKGLDLFVQLAWLVRRARPDVATRFLWLGADPGSGEPGLRTPLADRHRLGLDDVVTFLPPTDRVFDHLRLADAFVLTSREDASPLVCLEAAAVGLPVVCFDNGGIPAILGPEGGVTVAYPDLEGMADALLALHDQPDRRRRIGRAGQARVRDGHDIRDAGPRIHDVMAAWVR